MTTFAIKYIWPKYSISKKVFRSDALNGLSILNRKEILMDPHSFKAFLALAIVSIIWEFQLGWHQNLVRHTYQDYSWQPSDKSLRDHYS